MMPLMVCVGCAIWLCDGRPIFFLQKRVGRFGRPFTIYKFRTMRQCDSDTSPELTVTGDKRITQCGRVLRESKLDELPQLLNVIKGDMSFVGPRPEVAKYVAKYTPAQRRVLSLTPGITDEASIVFAHENQLLGKSQDPERLYIELVMPEKIRLNLRYSERATVISDIGVIFRTVFRILAVPTGRPDAASLDALLPGGGLDRHVENDHSSDAAA